MSAPANGTMSSDTRATQASQPNWLKAGWSPVVAHLFETILLIVLIAGLAQFFQYAARVVAYPYQVDYGEGPLLDQAMRLARFENIYRADLSAPPFVITNYPPLFVMLQAPLTALFGPAFWYGRLISLLSTLAGAVFIMLMLRALTSDWLPSIVGGATFLVIPYALTWAPLNRVDPLALALSMAALFVIVRWPDRRWSLPVTAALLIAAVYTRQSYGLAAPMAAFFWLLGHRPRRRAFVLAGMVGGVGLGLFLVLNLFTRGGFYFNVVTANANEFQMPTLTRYVGLTLVYLPLLPAMIVLFFGLVGGLRMQSGWLAIPYLIGATASGLTIGKIGSNVNYLIEFSAAVGLMIGLILAALRQWRAGQPAGMRRVAVGGIAGLVTLALAGQSWMLMRAPGSYHWTILQQTQQALENKVLLKIIQDTDGPVLTDQHMGLLALAQRPIYYQPFEMKQLASAGVWDQTPFLQALERREYPTILTFRQPNYPLHKRRWTDEMLAIISRQYREDANLSGTLVLRPK